MAPEWCVRWSKLWGSLQMNEKRKAAEINGERCVQTTCIMSAPWRKGVHEAIAEIGP